MSAKRQQQISDQVDGRLRPRQRERLLAAAAQDPDLAAELQAWERTVAVLQAMPEERAPASLASSVMAAVATEPPPLRQSAVASWLRDQCQPKRLLATATACGLVLAVVALARPERIELSPAEEAFVRSALRDYHQVSGQTEADAVSEQDNLGSDSLVKF